MSRIFSSLFCLFFCRLVCAQGGLNIDSLMNDMPDVGDNLYISVVVEENENYTSEATRLLQNNLNHAVAQNGFLDTDGASPFFIAMNYNVLSKDIVPGMPVRISQEVQFNFIIGDAKEEKAFSSYACVVRGVGTNEQKAIIAAIRRIPWNDSTFKDFIKEGKQGITTYYDQRIPQIIEEANLLERQGKYEQAISKLTTIPKACRQYSACMRRALQVYQNMIDHDAYKWLAEAKKAWAASPDKAGAERVIALVDSIPSDSRYEVEVDSLLADVRNRIKEIDDQEWKLKMEKIKAENRAADRRMMAEASARRERGSSSIGGLFSGGSSRGNGKSFFGHIADKWRAQPTWKKVLIAGGVGLAIGGGVLTWKAAGAILARTSFHVVKMI